MKKLGDMGPETKARLERIGKAIEKWADEDPMAATYSCGKCGDTGFIVKDVTHPRMKQLYVVGQPCLWCGVGRRIAERVLREREERRNPKKPEPRRRKQTDEEGP